MKKLSTKKKILIVLFVLILTKLLFVSYSFINNFIVFNDHKKYFEKPIEEQVPKIWMSINYIERTYEINLEKKFWYEVWIWRKNSTLADYCEKYTLNCSEVILTIEQNKNGN